MTPIGDSQHEFTRWFEDELPSFGISRTGLGEVKPVSRGRCVHTPYRLVTTSQGISTSRPLWFVKSGPHPWGGRAKSRCLEFLWLFSRKTLSCADVCRSRRVISMAQTKEAS